MVQIYSHCIAAPTPAAELTCKPYGKPSPLIGDFSLGDYKNTLGFTGSEHRNGYTALQQVPNNQNSYLFQFYHCAAPSDHYSNSYSNVLFSGQIRSVDQPGMCVTSNVVKVPDNRERTNATNYPVDADPAITLQPCATSPSLQLRKQWMRIWVSNVLNDGKYPIDLDGWNTDPAASYLVPDSATYKLNVARPAQKINNNFAYMDLDWCSE